MSSAESVPNSISIIVPARNEAEGIGNIIRELQQFSNDIIVVDGHSQDGTREIARNRGAKVILDNRRGKGDALRVGIRQAQGDILVFIDADGSHELKDIPRLVEPIIQERADLVVASRHLGGSDELHGDLNNFLRSLGGGIITLSINYRWNVRLTDSLNGFRAIRKSVALSLNLTANDFDIEQQMVCKCLKKGYRVIEIASHEYARKWGKSKLPTHRKGILFFRRLFIDLITR